MSKKSDMQSPIKFLVSVLLLVVSSTSQWAQDAVGVSKCAVNDVIWTTPGKNENDSMPIGNGDVAANVWTEQNGDVVLLVAKADAWTDLGKLEIGRAHV